MTLFHLLVMIVWVCVTLPTTVAFSATTATSSSSTSSSSSPPSIGQLIQDAEGFEEAIQVAEKFWLPTDPNLPLHYYQQAVHNDARRRWASQLLEKLAGYPLENGTSSSSEHLSSSLLADSRLTRLLLAAALPQADAPPEIVVNPKCHVWMLNSVTGIYALIGRLWTNGIKPSTTDPNDFLPIETVEAIHKIMDYCLTHSESISLEKACSLLWIVNGLRARIPRLQAFPPSHYENALSCRVADLPFEIIPLGLDWAKLAASNALPTTYPIDGSSALCRALKDDIPFQKDSIVTRRGTTVSERRGTAWVADDGIGALAYSGKLMVPHSPLPGLVKAAMNAVEHRLEDIPSDFFDCALCNHYADAQAACKLHTDPEHGTLWHRTTVVVAAGSDRKFSFKPIKTTWKDWDPLDVPSPMEAATVHLFSGDLVVMKDSCNDDFFHAVHAGISDEERISLVLKRALERNGHRGHGLPGQGRRSGKKRERRFKIAGQLDVGEKTC